MQALHNTNGFDVMSFVTKLHAFLHITLCFISSAYVQGQQEPPIQYGNPNLTPPQPQRKQIPFTQAQPPNISPQQQLHLPVQQTPQVHAARTIQNQPAQMMNTDFK